MQKEGIWHGRGYRPQQGDVCYYDWDGGGADHVGIVVAVNGNSVTVREGNKNNQVGSSSTWLMYYEIERSSL